MPRGHYSYRVSPSISTRAHSLSPPSPQYLLPHPQFYSQIPELRPPNCSICSAPQKSCTCEFTSLIIAAEDSEQRVLGGLFDDIRRFVTQSAQSTIHRKFGALAATRRQHYIRYVHEQRLDPHEVERLRRQVESDVDEDWRRCVREYPEVLDQWYEVVEDAVRSGRGMGELLGRSGDVGRSWSGGTSRRSYR